MWGWNSSLGHLQQSCPCNFVVPYGSSPLLVPVHQTQLYLSRRARQGPLVPARCTGGMRGVVCCCSWIKSGHIRVFELVCSHGLPAAGQGQPCSHSLPTGRQHPVLGLTLFQGEQKSSSTGFFLPLPLNLSITLTPPHDLPLIPVLPGWVLLLVLVLITSFLA